MANYLETQMTSMADIIREKANIDAESSLSITSMISTLLNATGETDYTNVALFLQRDIETLNLPTQAVSIGPYAFAFCDNLTALHYASGIQYKLSAFYSCPTTGKPTGYSNAGGTYNKHEAAPPREPNGDGAGASVDPSIKEELLNPERYEDAPFNTYIGGLASTIRAIEELEDPLTLRSMVDLVSDMQFGTTNNILARLIDRSVSELTVPEETESIGSCGLRSCINLSEITFPTHEGFWADESALVNCAANLHMTVYDRADWTYAFNHTNSIVSCTYVGHPHNQTSYVYSSRYWMFDEYGEMINGGDLDYGYAKYDSIINTPTVLMSGHKRAHYSGHSDVYFLGSVDFQNASILGENAFKQNKDLTELDLTGVQLIDFAAFENSDKLISVTWPETDFIIGINAFGDTGLVSVNLGTNVKYCGNGAFRACSNLESVGVTTPTGTSRLDREMFYSCSALSSATIGGAITIIGPRCFHEDSALLSCGLPTGVVEIQEEAFRNCVSMQLTAYPTALVQIDNNAFRSCYWLPHASFGPTKLKCIGREAFYECSRLQVLQGCATLSHIGRSAFALCEQLTSVELNTTILTSINYDIFSSCTNLLYANLSNNRITLIDDGAFQNCYSLTHVKFPNSLKLIGSAAFGENHSLCSTLLGATQITSIGDDAFSQCESIISCTFPSTLQYVGSAAFWSACRIPKILLNNTNVASICAFAFGENQAATSIFLNTNTLQYIGEKAFAGCSDAIISFGPNISYIDSHAFDACYCISNLSLANVQSLINGAFANCVNISSCTLPATLQYLDSYVFTDCSKLSAGSRLMISSNGTIYSNRVYVRNTAQDSLGYYAWTWNNSHIYTYSNTYDVGVGNYVYSKKYDSDAREYYMSDIGTVAFTGVSTIRCRCASSIIFNTDGTFKNGWPGVDRFSFYFN